MALQSYLNRRSGMPAILAAIAMSHLGVTTAFGGGLAVFGQDARAIARGNAFAATTDNASAVFYNPAGLVQTAGQQFQVGAYSLTYQTEY